MRIVLASASPRRREILDQIGIKYDVCVSEVDEHSIEKDPKKLVMLLSERKAEAFILYVHKKELRKTVTYPYG